MPTKKQKISFLILSKIAEGLSTRAAVDAVLGAGTFQRVADEVWEAARKAPAINVQVVK